MKFETQTHGIIVNWKISKPEVAIKIQDGRRRHLGFHIIGCHFIANCPIWTKFCTQMPPKVSQTKNLKMESYFEIQDGDGRYLEFLNLELPYEYMFQISSKSVTIFLNNSNFSKSKMAVAAILDLDCNFRFWDSSIYNDAVGLCFKFH